MAEQKASGTLAIWWSVAVCGVLFVLGIVFGILSKPYYFAISLLAVVLALFLIYLARQIRAAARKDPS